MADEISQFMDAAQQAAGAAGALIRENWLRPKEIAYKGAIDLVTSIDRASEHRIVEMLRQKFPGHAILAEEQPEIDPGKTPYRWIVDPLDGTTNFAHGYPQFCVSIALELRGEVILGVVYDPIRDECFSAAKGRPATLNGDPVKTSAVGDLDKALLATGFPYDRRQHADYYLGFFKAFMLRSQGIRRGGSAALDLCYVACGRIDGFWELKLRPWDIAAGALIVAQAGGSLSDFAGRPFSIWGEETLATNGLIHAQMQSVASALIAAGAVRVDSPGGR